MINALMGHEFTWERPKGQSGSGETQLNRPSYCPARPCCTWAPSSFSFYQSQTRGQGKNTHLSFSCQLQMVCLAFPLPNCNHRDKKLLTSSAWVHCQNSAYLPATWKSTKVSLPKGKKAKNGIAISKTPLSLFWKWPKESPHKSADWGTEVITKNPPRGNPNP